MDLNPGFVQIHLIAATIVSSLWDRGSSRGLPQCHDDSRSSRP